jgi:hypothetical protein
MQTIQRYKSQQWLLASQTNVKQTPHTDKPNYFHMTSHTKGRKQIKACFERSNKMLCFFNKYIMPQMLFQVHNVLNPEIKTEIFHIKNKKKL